jgi:hypothetical protein
MRKLLAILLVLLLGKIASAQAPRNIDKPVSVQYKNTKIEVVLADLEAKSGIRFSYSPAIFDNYGTVTYSASNQSVKVTLLEILDGGISFKTRGNYVILQKKKEEAEREFLVMGYISNEKTNERISNASIYEPSTLASAVSGQSGYYQIRLRSSQASVRLKIQKKDFESQLVPVPFRKTSTINIGLKPKTTAINPKFSPIQPIPPKPDSNIVVKTDSNTNKLLPKTDSVMVKIEPKTDSISPILEKATAKKPFENVLPTVKAKSEQFMDWLMSTTQKIHFRNLDDSLSRPFQLSLVPYIGSNGRLSSAVSNDYSVNIISGVSRSVHKLEIGGALNLVRENMTGIQMAGFGNVVGKSQTGLQLAGFANANFGSSTGVLSAGFANLTFGKSDGLQMAGFANTTLGTFAGTQMAGFANVSLQKTKAVQLAGFANIAKDTLSGVQIAPFNKANYMKNGLQLGVVNILNEAENVLPIGVFSFVRKGGYRRLELSANEIGLVEVAFKTGVRSFYNILTAQYNPRSNSIARYGIGYGIGSSAKILKRLNTDANFVVSQLAPSDWNFDTNTQYSQMANLNLNIELKLGTRLALFGGPSYIWYSSTQPDFDIASIPVKRLKTNSLNWWASNQTIYQWPGFKLGLRLCNI